MYRPLASGDVDNPLLRGALNCRTRRTNHDVRQVAENDCTLQAKGEIRRGKARALDHNGHLPAFT
jgi:hypothetical protein